MKDTDRTVIPTIRMEVEDIRKSRPTVKIKQDKAYYAALARKARGYKALPNQMRPALEGVADYVRQVMIPRTFRQEGPGWRRLSLRTQREREFAGYDPKHPILRRTGDLMNELTQKSHPSHIEIIRVGKNARIEIGGSSKKFVENQMGMREQNLPARPMVPGTGNIRIEDRDRIAMAEIIRRSLKKQFKARVT